MSGAPQARLVVLDRDGVVNRDSEAYIKSPDEWQPLPGSLEAIARLSAAGFDVVVASNQSGVGRGLFGEAELDAITAKMNAAIDAAGGRLAAVYYCPHHPDAGCDCRKPKPGLLERIARDFGVSLAGVPVVGDSQRDLDAARAVGARPILVLTGNGERTRAALGPSPEVEIYADLAAVADRLLDEAAR